MQKTIEHYTFADALDVASIVIEAEKDSACCETPSSSSPCLATLCFREDLFEGAAEHVKEEQVEADTTANL